MASSQSRRWFPCRQLNRVEIAAAVLGTKIAFANEPRSSVLRVLVTTQNPKLSARIANEIRQAFP